MTRDESQVIPAQPGYTLLVFYCDDLEVQRSPIIGWRIDRELGVQAIGLLYIRQNTVAKKGILCPDRRVFDPMMSGPAYKNEAEWLVYAKEFAAWMRAYDAAVKVEEVEEAPA